MTRLSPVFAFALMVCVTPQLAIAQNEQQQLIDLHKELIQEFGGWLDRSGNTLSAVVSDLEERARKRVEQYKVNQGATILSKWMEENAATLPEATRTKLTSITRALLQEDMEWLLFLQSVDSHTAVVKQINEQVRQIERTIQEQYGYAQ